mmetsp:Transcript_12169/g.14475  ORF Transcript_12169/g.14475 Transcript_12169/m.14475 type:complete len:1077 (+) Transcript_12169:4551-7781(+)
MDIGLEGVKLDVDVVHNQVHLDHVVAGSLTVEGDSVGAILMVDNSITNSESDGLSVEVEGSDNLNLVGVTTHKLLVSALVEGGQGEDSAVAGNSLGEGSSCNLSLGGVSSPGTADGALPEALGFRGSDNDTVKEHLLSGGLAGEVVCLEADTLVELEVRNQVGLRSGVWALDGRLAHFREHREGVDLTVELTDLIGESGNHLLVVLLTKDDGGGCLGQELHSLVVDGIQEDLIHVQHPLLTVVGSGNVLPGVRLHDSLPGVNLTVLVALNLGAEASSVDGSRHTSVVDSESETVEAHVGARDNGVVAVNSVWPHPCLDGEWTGTRPQVLSGDQLLGDITISCLPPEGESGAVTLISVRHVDGVPALVQLNVAHNLTLLALRLDTRLVDHVLPAAVGCATSHAWLGGLNPQVVDRGPRGGGVVQQRAVTDGHPVLLQVAGVGLCCDGLTLVDPQTEGVIRRDGEVVLGGVWRVDVTGELHRPLINGEARGGGNSGIVLLEDIENLEVLNTRTEEVGKETVRALGWGGERDAELSSEAELKSILLHSVGLNNLRVAKDAVPDPDIVNLTDEVITTDLLVHEDRDDLLGELGVGGRMSVHVDLLHDTAVEDTDNVCPCVVDGGEVGCLATSGGLIRRQRGIQVCELAGVWDILVVDPHGNGLTTSAGLNTNVVLSGKGVCLVRVSIPVDHQGATEVAGVLGMARVVVGISIEGEVADESLLQILHLKGLSVGHLLSDGTNTDRASFLVKRSERVYNLELVGTSDGAGGGAGHSLKGGGDSKRSDGVLQVRDGGGHGPVVNEFVENLLVHVEHTRVDGREVKTSDGDFSTSHERAGLLGGSTGHLNVHGGGWVPWGTNVGVVGVPSAVSVGSPHSSHRVPDGFCGGCEDTVDVTHEVLGQLTRVEVELVVGNGSEGLLELRGGPAHGANGFVKREGIFEHHHLIHQTVEVLLGHHLVREVHTEEEVSGHIGLTGGGEVGSLETVQEHLSVTVSILGQEDLVPLVGCEDNVATIIVLHDHIVDAVIVVIEATGVGHTRVVRGEVTAPLEDVAVEQFLPGGSAHGHNALDALLGMGVHPGSE